MNADFPKPSFRGWVALAGAAIDPKTGLESIPMNTPHTFYRTLAGSWAFFAGLLAALFAFSTGAVAADNPVVSGSGSATYSYSAPAEFCVNSVELNVDIRKFVQRFNFRISPVHHFLKGDVFVWFWFPYTTDYWFHGGDISSVNGFKPASWYSFAEHGPTAYYSGILNPIIPVNVVPSPLDVFSLLEGRIFAIAISYGLRENANSSVADSYQEMKRNSANRERFSMSLKMNEGVTYPDDGRGGVRRYCFIVTGVKKEVACAPGEC